MNYTYLGHEIRFAVTDVEYWNNCPHDCPDKNKGEAILLCSICPHEHVRAKPYWSNYDARELEKRQIAFEHAVLKHLEKS